MLESTNCLKSKNKQCPSQRSQTPRPISSERYSSYNTTKISASAYFLSLLRYCQSCERATQVALMGQACGTYSHATELTYENQLHLSTPPPAPLAPFSPPKHAISHRVRRAHEVPAWLESSQQAHLLLYNHKPVHITTFCF